MKPRPQSKQRPHRLEVTLSPEELKRLEALAYAQHRTRPETIRVAILYLLEKEELENPLR